MIIDLFDNHHHHGNFYDLIIMFVTVYSDEIFCMIWSSQDFVLKQYQGQIILFLQISIHYRIIRKRRTFLRPLCLRFR